MPVWQSIYEELKDQNFEIVSAAQDTGGEAKAGPIFDRANVTYTAIVDVNHTISTLFNLVTDRKMLRGNIDALKIGNGSTQNVIYALSKGIGSIAAISNIIDETLKTDKDTTIGRILKFSSYIPLGLTIFDILFNSQEK